MPSSTASITPGLPSFLRTLKTSPVESSIEQFISLLKRRQIRNSRPCALATTQLLLRVVADFKGRDVAKLMARIRHVGQRLTAAQPREMAVGNIVRRVLGLVREVVEDDNEGDTPAMSEAGQSPPSNDVHQRPGLTSSISTFSPLKHGATQPTSPGEHHAQSLGESTFTHDDSSVHRPPLIGSHTSYAQPNAPIVTSLFGLFSHPSAPSPTSTPTGHSSPSMKPLTHTNLAMSELTLNDKAGTKDIKADVIEGIREILDELDQCTEQIAGYALEHIHADEIVLVHGSSTTVQKFLLTAARKRKFTVVHVESYPNDHLDTYSTVMNGRKKPGTSSGSAIDDEEESVDDMRFKPLTSAGISVILIPDAAVFAIMSRVNKVILATHTVLANGGLIASVGARNIAQAARAHQTPVVVLSGVYKLSPLYPFDTEELVEYGDSSRVLPYEDGKGVDGMEVVNPINDYVEAGLVDLYITNLGGHAPSYLYRIVADHYHVEDVNL
ncbi:nagb/rpia/CoA transferase-like protein [Rhizodiscina lignyota]|uniref:Translation initiation factor eIF2B subunit beta n=1 Tax=Rhizodiscina lignyota TaxID=1504668 RepID=A0A9P4IJS1_9PEZI|nr:nagb/rpia/CoA transferase-like protein [Rhizodiscina lignyota]